MVIYIRCFLQVPLSQLSIFSSEALEVRNTFFQIFLFGLGCDGLLNSPNNPVHHVLLLNIPFHLEYNIWVIVIGHTLKFQEPCPLCRLKKISPTNIYLLFLNLVVESLLDFRINVHESLTVDCLLLKKNILSLHVEEEFLSLSRQLTLLLLLNGILKGLNVTIPTSIHVGNDLLYK